MFTGAQRNRKTIRRSNAKQWSQLRDFQTQRQWTIPELLLWHIRGEQVIGTDGWIKESLQGWQRQQLPLSKWPETPALQIHWHEDSEIQLWSRCTVPMKSRWAPHPSMGLTAMCRHFTVLYHLPSKEPYDIGIAIFMFHRRQRKIKSVYQLAQSQ